MELGKFLILVFKTHLKIYKNGPQKTHLILCILSCHDVSLGVAARSASAQPLEAARRLTKVIVAAACYISDSDLPILKSSRISIGYLLSCRVHFTQTLNDFEPYQHKGFCFRWLFRSARRLSYCATDP